MTPLEDLIHEYKDRTQPVRKGHVYDVEISELGEKGDGIATIKGFVIFVPGTKVGDKVRIKVQKVRDRFSFAEVVQRW